MNILSIDTSCDETSAAVTQDDKILSNVIWSQASLHAKYGGVYPSLAQRAHQERIDFVIEKALTSAFPKKYFAEKSYQLLAAKYIDTIAVTAGPGLAIALGVGVNKAKELAIKINKPLIAVNHLEGHILSPLAFPRIEVPDSEFQISDENQKEKRIKQISFPAFGLVISGKNTLLVLINKIGTYKTLATVVDDALGEALDKAARMLGFGYPGGAILEKLAREGDSDVYKLPVPLLGQEERMVFSYSGLKTALWRLAEKEKNGKTLNKTQVANLAASFQKSAFEHLIRICRFTFLKNKSSEINDFLVGGGVASNVEVRKLLRKLCREFGLTIHFPFSDRLYMDNAAMIGLAAYFKAKRHEYEKNIDLVDREASAKIDKLFKWRL